MTLVLASCGPTPETRPPTGTITCSTFPGWYPQPVGWSADGRTLAVRAISAGDSAAEYAGVLSWPALVQSQIASDVFNLTNLAPDNDGKTLYLWGKPGGRQGIWILRSGQAPKLIGPVVSDVLADITWTPKGIVRLEVGSNLALVGLVRMDWTGHEEEILPIKQRDDIWVDTDGAWIADMERLSPGKPESIVVYHSGQAVVLQPGVAPNLIGMTPAHDAVVYRTMYDALHDSSVISLHILPLDGRPESTINIATKLKGAADLLLSSQGVLAFDYLHFQTNEVCVVPLAFPRSATDVARRISGW